MSLLIKNPWIQGKSQANQSPDFPGVGKALLFFKICDLTLTSPVTFCQLHFQPDTAHEFAWETDKYEIILSAFCYCYSLLPHMEYFGPVWTPFLTPHIPLSTWNVSSSLPKTTCLTKFILLLSLCLWHHQDWLHFYVPITLKNHDYNFEWLSFLFLFLTKENCLHSYSWGTSPTLCFKTLSNSKDSWRHLQTLLTPWLRMTW